MKLFTKSTTILAVLSAGAMLAAVLGGCGGTAGSGELSAEKAYAEKKLSAFVSGQNAASFAYSDAAFSKANIAAMLYAADSSDEGLQKIARNLSLESLTIVDEKGTVAASYPEGEKGKSIKELEGKSMFTKIVKGLSDKLMNDPVYNADENTYEVLAGVRKGDEGGAVIIGFKDAGYASVTGGDLADSCGLNTVVLQKDNVISSTLEGVETGTILDAMGIKDDDLSKDSFSMTADGKTYTAMAVQKGDFVVITAAPA